MVQPASKRLLTEANAAAQAADSATPLGAALSATYEPKGLALSTVKAAAAPLGGVTRVVNLSPRPNSASASDWFANSFGTGGVGTKTVVAGAGYNGRNGYVMEWTTASTATGTNTGPQIESPGSARSSVTAGLPTTGSIWIEAINTASDVDVYIRIFFKDASDVTLLSAGSAVLKIRAGAGPQRVYAPTTQAPAGTVKAFVNTTVWTASQVGTGKLVFSCPQVSQSTATFPYRDGDYIDAKWLGTANGSASAAVPARFDRIACFGDSHFELASGGGYPLPTHMQKLLPGIEVINAGRGGEPSTGITARAGTTTLAVTVAGGSIPATTDAVNVTVSPSTTYRPTGSFPILGELAGVGGTLRISENVWTFTRSFAGSAVTVPAGSAFTAYGVPRAADVWLLMAGNNLHNFADVRRDTEAFVQACKAAGRNYLIQSLYNNVDEPAGSAGYNDIIAINQANEAAYPGHYIDVRRILIDQGLSLLGITPTAADTTAISEDRIPPSLMADTVHLTDDARRFIVAPLLVQTMRRRGMIPA